MKQKLNKLWMLDSNGRCIFRNKTNMGTPNCKPQTTNGNLIDFGMLGGKCTLVNQIDMGTPICKFPNLKWKLDTL